MAHGTSATISMVTDRYAQVFQDAGFAVLLYDHRNFGDSGGEPRQEINPWVQARGYRDAVTFVQSLEGIDHDRIAPWGDSYSAAQVLIVGAVDDRVAAIVAQVPSCGSDLSPPDPAVTARAGSTSRPGSFRRRRLRSTRASRRRTFDGPCSC